MKKLVIVTRNMSAGGAERVIAQLVNSFVNKEIECIIITLDNKEIFYQINKKVKIKPIGKKSNNVYLDKFLKYKTLRKMVKIESPDIVLVLPEEIAIYTLPALIGLNIPIVVSERNNPWIMPWKKITRILRKMFYPFASGFIFQTEQASTFFSPSIRKKGKVLLNPLDLQRIPSPWKGKRSKEIVSVGRLEKQKNFPLLIKAFAKFYEKHSDYILTIYGEGSLKDELLDLASSLLPKDAYRFPGKDPDVLNCIVDAAIFVLSSDYEGLPNVLMETMATGMPVISTNCPSGGPAELIRNGENGILVPVGDVNSLAKAMCKIVESKGLSQLLGENASMVGRRFDSKTIANEWLEYLNYVVRTY